MTETAHCTRMKNKGSEIKAYKIVKDSEKLLPNEGAIEQKYEKS